MCCYRTQCCHGSHVATQISQGQNTHAARPGLEPGSPTYRASALPTELSGLPDMLPTDCVLELALLMHNLFLSITRSININLQTE